MKILDTAEQFIREKQDTGIDNASIRRFALYLETFNYVIISARESVPSKRKIKFEQI